MEIEIVSADAVSFDLIETYRVVLQFLVDFVVAAGTTNITIMTGIGEMHARRNGCAQIG